MVDIIMQGSVGTLLMKIFSEEDRAKMWLINGNINLGGAVPLCLIEQGRAEKVILFIESAIAGY